MELEIEHFTPECTHLIHYEKIQQGLHNEPDKLRNELQNAINRAEQLPNVNTIVLGYGLCGCGTVDLKTSRCQLVIPRAHDCITLLLGSKERYADYTAKHPGTYWYSPGWNHHHDPPGPTRHANLYNEYLQKYGEDNAKYLMESEQHWFSTYNRATYVHLTVGATEQDRKFTKDCADWLKWDYDEQPGDPTLVCDMLHGHWDHDRFLVLEPGQSIQASADDMIIKSSPQTQKSKP
ncbi:DUF1638 domain-containing protein [Poriferisphaera sp. WC338]|uniref:DUF1638 domain-containing protein n=1 Tax=Poriferisphaera sp. WC338 TaxID=3425129 RepID=UPI003D818B4E